MIWKYFIQFACTNLDGSQKEGSNFFYLLWKEGLPRKGGGFLQKRGGSSPGGNYEWVEYCERLDRLKLRITRPTLATFSGNIWSRLKSPKINILCCVGSSLINKRKSSVKYQEDQVYDTVITKSPFLFPVQIVIPLKH